MKMNDADQLFFYFFKNSINQTPKVRSTHKFELNFGIIGFRQYGVIVNYLN